MILKNYEWADYVINDSPKYATGFTQLLAVKPYSVPRLEMEHVESRLSVIRMFQKNAVQLFRKSIETKDPKILHWLLNDTPSCLAYKYHLDLEERHYTIPVFFRTDEVKLGRIVEIQCPGSLWGELQLMHDYITSLGFQDGFLSPAHQFSKQLINYLNQDPVIHHMLDNASGPPGMRYFIEKTRSMLKYWGIDKGIMPKDCNFIRSHSFWGLCADNDFKSRLINVGKGVTFDLPPHVLFDQKATLVLPFWSLTSKYFSDEIRSILVFSTPLRPEGIELVTGEHITIEDFANLPRDKRAYFLKYAGSDVALNWGSKAVYRLKNMGRDSCLNILKTCLSKFESGQIWLLQKDEAQDDIIEYITRDNIVHQQKMRAKFSSFYGPFGCLGVLAMHRTFYKVHGQPDTSLSFVLSEPTEIPLNSKKMEVHNYG